MHHSLNQSVTGRLDISSLLLLQTKLQGLLLKYTYVWMYDFELYKELLELELLGS